MWVWIVPNKRCDGSATDLGRDRLAGMASAAQLSVYPTGVSSRPRSDLGGEERATLHKAKDLRTADSDDEDGERDKQNRSRKPILPPPPPPRAGKVGD